MFRSMINADISWLFAIVPYSIQEMDPDSNRTWGK